MCYDIAQMKKRAVRYAKLRAMEEEVIAELERELEVWVNGESSHHCVSGFAHPEMLVFTDDRPLSPQLFRWGLIPSWVKDVHQASLIQNQTLNARGETIFEKPSFKLSAHSKRCLIYVDAFYEYHHYKGKTYPFHISMKDGSPICLAGLWDAWADPESGEWIPTVSMVTTKANVIMAKIHNNPKHEEPRMPLILSSQDQDEWLIPCNNAQDKERLLNLIKPFPDALLNYHTVKRLRGKEAVGDVAEAEEPFVYPELIWSAQE